MGVGVRTSQSGFVGRSPDRATSTQTATEWTVARDSWTSASEVVRFGCVLGAALAITAVVVGAIPIASGLVIAASMPAVLVDTQQRRLPDVWLGVAALVLLVGVGVSWSTGATVTSPVGLAIGAALMAVPLLVLHLASPSSMGFGDVKLAVVLGGAIGVLDWRLAIPALAIAAGSTATVGVVTRARLIAFGPGLVGGALVAMLANDLLVSG